jgi:hypothetical protein
VTRNPAHTRSHLRLGWAVGAALVAAASLPAFAEDVADHLSLLDQTGTQVVEEVLAQIKIPPGTVVHLVPESPHAANWLVARLFERALVARGYVVIAPPYDRQRVPQAGASPASQPQASPPTSPPVAPEGLNDEQERDLASSETSEGGGDEGSEPEETSGDASESDAGAEAEETISGAETPASNGTPAQPRAASASAAGAPGEAAEFEVPLPARGEVLAYHVVECGVRYPWAKRTLLVGPRRYGRMVSVKLWASWISEPGHRVKEVAHGERVHLDSFPGWARTYVEGQGFPFTIDQPPGSSVGKWIEPVVVAGIASGLVYLFYQNQK